MARDSRGTGRGSRSLKEKGMEVGLKVVAKVMQDPERARAVIDAVDKIQKGKERLDQTTRKIRNAGHLPSRDDVARLSRHVGALRRETRRLKTRLEKIRRQLERAAK